MDSHLEAYSAFTVLSNVRRDSSGPHIFGSGRRWKVLWGYLSSQATLTTSTRNGKMLKDGIISLREKEAVAIEVFNFKSFIWMQIWSCKRTQ